MYSEGGTTVVHKRLSFLSILILSLTAIIVAVILSASGIAIYGLRIVDKKSDGLIGLIVESAQSLPEVRKALPPVLADAINDQRQPDYRNQLDVDVHRISGRDDERSRAVIQVTNRGEKIVSLLSMRIVGDDASGNPVFERNTWVATPLQIEGDWRGPLLPHETRRFSIRCASREEITSINHEITDLRIWQGNTKDGTPEQVERELEQSPSKMPPS